MFTAIGNMGITRMMSVNRSQINQPRVSGLFSDILVFYVRFCFCFCFDLFQRISIEFYSVFYLFMLY